jgi:nucleotide-binding universal stress UspA family protein
MKILLASDGSDSADASLEFLLSFPFPKHSEVTLLTVVDKTALGERATERLEEEHRKMLRETEESLRQEGEALIAAGVERLRKAGWTGSTEVRLGHPAHEIVQAAEADGADLVVVGFKGTTGVKRFLLGSVSERVLRHAPCSVLLVRRPATARAETSPAEEQGPCRALLAYDDSAPARKAVELCASLPMDEKAEVTLVTVLPLITLYRQDVRQRLSSFWQQKKKAAQAALDRVGNQVRWTTPHVQTQLRESPDVSQAILDAATEIQSDVIMLGDRGKSAIEKFLLGSVAKRIASHAPCSVWVVRN